MKFEKFVLDANIYVSALLTQRGYAMEMLESLERNEIELLVSEPILEEIQQLLAHPTIVKLHRKSIREIEEFVSALRAYATLIEPDIKLEAFDASYIPDSRYIECGVSGKADILISHTKEGTCFKPPEDFLDAKKMREEARMCSSPYY